MKFYLETITVLFDSPLSKKSRVPGWVESFRMWKKRVNFREIPATGKEVFGPTSKPSQQRPKNIVTRDERDERDESPQVDFNSLDVVFCGMDVFCGFRISDFCFFTMFRCFFCGERCGFQCILEKRCWTKCWPTCFFSLSVLLESELVCEVWDDYLNKQAAFWCGIRYLNLTGSFFGLQVEIRMLIHYESGHVFWVLIGQWVS